MSSCVSETESRSWENEGLSRMGATCSRIELLTGCEICCEG